MPAIGTVALLAVAFVVGAYAGTKWPTVNVLSHVLP